MSENSELAELFKRAAAVAATLPESMQEAGFHRALDALQGASSQDTPKPPKRSVRKKPELKDDDADAVALLKDLDRDRAVDVDDQDGAQAKALALLRVAFRELGIDGLTASQIADVLREKFRFRVTRQAINQALDKAGRAVDRRSGPRGATAYRLMEAGEKWLDTPADQRGALGGGASPNRRRTSKKVAKAPASGEDASSKASKKAASAKRGGGGGGRPRPARGGPKAAVESLIQAGWFSTARTLQAVREELEHSRALRYKTTDLAPAMTRLLRSGQLTRSKNADGQYEYIAPGA
jgi:hypothetical protein